MKIGVLKGNGIGPEITAAALRVVDACGLPVEWVNIPIAEEAIEKALVKASTEKTMRRAIEQGMLVTEAFEKFGVL